MEIRVVGFDGLGYLDEADGPDKSRRLRNRDEMEENRETTLAPPTIPDVPPTSSRLDPAAALAFRTPLQEHSPAADTKAAAVITVFGITFTVLARQSHILMQAVEEPGVFQLITVIALIGFAIMSLASILEAFHTIVPRFPPTPPSLAFFGDIAKLGREEYIKTVSTMSHDESLENILRYNHSLATICVLKFARLRQAIRFFRYGFAFWIILMTTITIRGVF